MKKTVSIMLCLLLIFSSVNFAFADFTSADSTNLSNLLSYTNTIKNALTLSNGTIYSFLNTIAARLTYSGENVAGLLYSINNKLNNSGGFSSTDSQNLLEILNFITYFTTGNTRQSWLQYIANKLDSINNSVARIQSDTGTLVDQATTLLGYQLSILGYTQNIDNVISTLTSNRSFMIWNSTGSANNWSLYDYRLNGNFAYSIPEALRLINYNTIYGFQKLFEIGFSNYSNTQTAKNWLNLQNITFTPTSQTNGIYTWLANIQEPIARISYVHASDEEIAAREKAAANQTAVVNNFIDSTGSGAAPTSSFGDVASMSAGYSSNMNTDASASGIWNIFNSNNFGWFSQETANQLDPTVSTRKGSSDFETPLLDQQISDIYKELGVDVND